jgi:hypothetical protein
MGLIEVIKAKPVQDFEKRITQLLDKNWNAFAFEAVDRAIDAIAAGDPFLQPFIDAADKTAVAVQSALKSANKAIWGINPESAVQKAKGTVSFNKPDLAAIEKLVKGQIAWIGNHGSESEIAKAVSELYGKLWGEGKTRKEIVDALRKEFSKYTPAKFVEKFGETRYWQMFTQHHATLSKTISSVSRIARTHKTYIFWARSNERTCEICGFYHNKTFETAGAVEEMNGYLKAAESGDIEAMKTARPFVTDTGSDRPMPPLHIGCRCRTLAGKE